jgi:hypothetical protein
MGIPTHYIKKRDLLHSEKSSAAVLAQTGREFLKIERFSDALDFLEKARDQEGIKQIKQIAMERGDTFLLSRLDRYDRELVSVAEWEEAGRKASSLGRDSMAEFVQKRLAAAQKALNATAVVAKPGEAPITEI